MKIEYRVGVFLMIISAFLSSIGQVFFKSASLNSDFKLALFYFIGLCFYGLGFLIMIFSLNKIPLSIAHPMLSFGFIFGLIFSSMIFNEDIGLKNITGVFSIIIGGHFLAK